MNKHLEPAGSSNGHEWVRATRPLSFLNGMIFCKICGNVKRRDDKNEICSGYRVFPDGTKCDGCTDCKPVGGE